LTHEFTFVDFAAKLTKKPRSFGSNLKLLPLALPVLILVPGSVCAADGDHDATFGTGGTVITDFSGWSDLASAMVLQPDGKIIVAGSTRQAYRNLSDVPDD
jgi:hypothetical protein